MSTKHTTKTPEELLAEIEASMGAFRTKSSEIITEMYKLGNEMDAMEVGKKLDELSERETPKIGGALMQASAEIAAKDPDFL
ncbi:MAG: hypothetical protein V4674_01820 [Patescibacteria group bacterium]